MTLSRFRVTLPRRIDGATEATITIDRERQVARVRPLRKRREYIIPLAEVAERAIYRGARVDSDGSNA